MAANDGLQHLLLLILLVFSQLISFNSVPASGIRHLLDESRDIPSSILNVTTHQRIAIETEEEEGININGRMHLEHNDYSGPGANGHHTPKPPSLKG